MPQHVLYTVQRALLRLLLYPLTDLLSGTRYNICLRKTIHKQTPTTVNSQTFNAPLRELKQCRGNQLAQD